MSALAFCEPCRAIIEHAAETADPYDVERLCGPCREIVLRPPATTGSYDWLRRLPIFDTWMRERGLRAKDI